MSDNPAPERGWLELGADEFHYAEADAPVEAAGEVVEYVRADLHRRAVEGNERLRRVLAATNQTIDWLSEQNERFRAELGLPGDGSDVSR